jgi:hypothetical protein
MLPFLQLLRQASAQDSANDLDNFTPEYRQTFSELGCQDVTIHACGEVRYDSLL